MWLILYFMYYIHLQIILPSISHSSISLFHIHNITTFSLNWKWRKEEEEEDKQYLVISFGIKWARSEVLKDTNMQTQTNWYSHIIKLQQNIKFCMAYTGIMGLNPNHGTNDYFSMCWHVYTVTLRQANPHLRGHIKYLIAYGAMLHCIIMLRVLCSVINLLINHDENENLPQ
jgi:hypothetical protein